MTAGRLASTRRFHTVFILSARFATSFSFFSLTRLGYGGSIAELCSARLLSQAQIAKRFDGAAPHLYRKPPRIPTFCILHSAFFIKPLDFLYYLYYNVKVKE